MRMGIPAVRGTLLPGGDWADNRWAVPGGAAWGTARLCVTLPFPRWQLLHSAASLSFRLEAATTPATSDSYSDRASSRSSAYSRRENRLAALSSRAEEESNRDYKKVGFLYVVLSLDAPWKLQQLSLERFPLSVSIAFGKDAHCSQMHQSYRGLKQGRG